MTYAQRSLFHLLWRDSGTQPEDFYHLAKRIFRGLTHEKWDKALKNFNILHFDEERAFKEFQAALFQAGGVYSKIY